jgi:hypothetical protein
VSTGVELERQVAAAADRYREIVASPDVAGIPEQGRHAAAKAVGRALQLLAFVLRRAADAGVDEQRLAELTGWQPELVRELLQRPPEPELVARVAPAAIDAAEVARAVADADASQRLHDLLGAILAEVDDDGWSPPAADLDELYGRLEASWHAWREGLRGARMR